ncbi:unnamed protein product [Dovyalis caffra]|uniref:Uncharacterized protein n=1 Tax=Dovyalis caffra TaxID=77055 RepID=A0AAV1R289_9ROSI|nr:unnamed protein product [Dovyalis caffra]
MIKHMKKEDEEGKSLPALPAFPPSNSNLIQSLYLPLDSRVSFSRANKTTQQKGAVLISRFLSSPPLFS